jgi:hypothetical protein
MKQRVSMVMLAAALVAPALVSAQAGRAAQPATMAPPAVISLWREIVKPGKGPAHKKIETAWTAAQVAAKSPVNFLAMETMSGPPEVWFLSRYASWAEFERMNKVFDNTAAFTAISDRFVPQENDYLSDNRGILATYREDLSYAVPITFGKMRYMSITTVQVRPGHVTEYEDVRKAVKAAHETAKLPDSYAVYQVVAGAPGGTFIQLVPRQSLAELDQATALHQGDAYTKALGGTEGQKKLDVLTSNAVAGTTPQLFSFSPAMSFPHPDWVAADPAYWTPKPATPGRATAPATKPPPPPKR